MGLASGVSVRSKISPSEGGGGGFGGGFAIMDRMAVNQFSSRV